MVNSGFNNAPPERTSPQEPGPMGGAEHSFILSQDKSMPIAIIGMGFRGPADATTVDRLWKMILEGREGWSEIPKSRWNNSAFYHPDNSRHGTINVKGGHFMTEDPSLFDAPFFNMTGDEASAMDPQQRLLLEVTYEGLENAGIPLPSITGTKTACFVGCFCADYTDLLLRDPESVPMYQCTNAGQSRAMTANRVSYFFDLKGPSVTVDTACSGSLVALHLACQSLQTGDSSMAIAAGVNVILSHEFMSTMSMMKFLSPDGRCYTFDENANGYARGEGIGCLILKPLSDAVRDGDTIRAVIRGSGTNQDGRTPGITLPSSTSQEALIRHVYDSAGLNPLETEFVEAHGTGTQAGDPIETGALSKVFAGRPAGMPLRIGSIKTNVGHLEGTSGIAGVIKAVLMLENNTFLPNRNFNTLNPRILLEEWNLKVQLELEHWTGSRPHRVSVNSFGYGGSNAHVVLEDASGYLSSRGLKGILGKAQQISPLHGALSSDGKGSTPNGAPGKITYRNRIFVLSGFDEGSCAMQVQKLREHLTEKALDADDDFMDNLAYTLNERRNKFIWKAAVTGRSPSSVIDALSSKAKPKRAAKKPTIGFVFTGQGAQWCGMGKELWAAYPVFRRSVERIDVQLKQIGAPFSVEEEMLRSKDSSRLSRPLLSQPICSALQISLVDLLASWGIFPDSVTGHSSGEIAAAYAVGALSMEDAMSVAYRRGAVAGKLSEYGNRNGAMLAVGMSARDIQPYLDSLSLGKVVVACKNSPSSLTISGDLAGIEELENILLQKQVFCRRLAVDVAYHSHHMQPLGDEYHAAIAHIQASGDDPPFQQNVSFFSSVTGTEITGNELGPQYWVRNLLSQVKFDESLQTLCFTTKSQKRAAGGSSGKKLTRAGAARKVSVDYLVEIGPHSALAGPIKQIIKADGKLSSADIMYGSILTRGSDAVMTALALAASLVSSGCNLAFDAVNRPAGSPGNAPQLLIDLPPYAWNHSRSYWAEPRMSKVYRERKDPRTDLLGVSDPISCPFEPRWRNFLRISEIPWLGDHKIQSNIVYPAAGYIAMAIEASSQLNKEGSSAKVAGYQLRDVSIQSALVINEASAIEIMVSLKQCESRQLNTVDREYTFHIYSVTNENRWTEHCKGIVGLQLEGHSDSSVSGFDTVEKINNPSRATAKNLSALDIKKFYENLEQVGLEYGPSFANMTEAHFTADTCFAVITIPDTAATMPMGFQHPFVIHPCTLDSTFHSIFVPMLAKMNQREEPPVPVFIDQVYVSSGISSAPGEKMDVQASVTEDDGGDITASLSVLDRNSCNNSPAVSIIGLKCRRLASGTTEGTVKPAERIAYNLKWEADPDLLTAEGLKRLLSEPALAISPGKASDLYEGAALYYVEEALKSIDTIDPATSSHLHRPWSLFTNALQARPTDAMSESPGKEVDMERAKEAGPKGQLLCVLGERIPSIMKGETDILKDRELSKLWDNAVHLHGCKAAARYLDVVSHKNPEVSILEVDVSTGASSTIFLQQLAGESGDIPRCSEFTCAHRDSSVLEAAAKSLAKWQKWTKFKALDIGENLEDQGFEHHDYDVVILPRGLGAVGSRGEALRNIHKLLRPNGHLVLVEPIPYDTLADNLIFGQFQGCWTDGSDEAAGSWISKSDWHRALCKAQFSGMGAFVEFSPGDSDFASTLIISRPRRDFQFTQTSVLVIAEKDDCGVSLSSLLDHLSRLSLKPEVSDLAHANPAGRVCIVLSDLKGSVFSQVDREVLEKLKQIFLQSTGVLWVTRGGMFDVTNPDAGLAVGFARTARSESGVSPIVTLDLDGQNPASGECAAEIISGLFRYRFLEGNSSDNDVEYAEKDGILQIPRVVESTQLNQAIATLQDHQALSEQAFQQEGRPLRAVLDKKAESVYFVDDTNITELRDTSVGVEVRAVCLDGGGDKLGPNLEAGCSGIVYSVGKEVWDFAPGDRVVYLGSGSVTSVYHDQGFAFQRIPPNLSLEEAAALPAAYCTALYVIKHIARINSDDTVLIHGAFGVSGQALVELCLWKQAHVFATVENATQRGILTSKYRIPEAQVFLDQDDSFIKAMIDNTRRKGVDIIINNRGPSSRLMKRSLKWIAPYGRYIHLGDEDNAGIPLLVNGAAFSTFNLRNLHKQRPVLVGRVWEEVMHLFREGKLEGPSSIPTYTITNINTALGSASQTGGSVILTTNPSDTIRATLRKRLQELFQSDASYMLVGGLGGIGRATALWMADHGARNLIFVNRSGLASAASRATVQALEDKGVHAVVHACNVSDEIQVHSMVSELGSTMPPVRGVIQAAMVLKDIHIEKMTVDDYHSVLQPKYAGTWNLHRYLPLDMDFFLMLSSISGVIGNATQSAYAAGSSFMDSFAAYRNSVGPPAVSLDLGVITDVGYLAENKELAAKMAQQGFNGTDTKALMSLIETAISDPRRDGTCAQIITGLGEWRGGQSLTNFDTPLFAQFRHQFSGDTTGQADNSAETLREELRLAKTLDEATGAIYSALSGRIASHLSLPAESINPSSPISEYGIDSHIAVELRNWISKRAESMVSILDILSSSSLLELSAKIGSKSQLVHVNPE